MQEVFNSNEPSGKRAIRGIRGIRGIRERADLRKERNFLFNLINTKKGNTESSGKLSLSKMIAQRLNTSECYVLFIISIKSWSYSYFLSLC